MVRVLQKDNQTCRGYQISFQAAATSRNLVFTAMIFRFLQHPFDNQLDIVIDMDPVKSSSHDIEQNDSDDTF